MPMNKHRATDGDESKRSLNSADRGYYVDELRDEMLETVTGGGMLSTALDNVVKSIGEALSTAARKG